MKERIAIVAGSWAEFVEWITERKAVLDAHRRFAFTETQEFYYCDSWERCAGMEFHSGEMIGTGYRRSDLFVRIKSKCRLESVNKRIKELVADENKTLRRMLWMLHTSIPGHLAYGDDGKMYCNTCLIDFKNDSVEEMRRKFTVQSLKEKEN